MTVHGAQSVTWCGIQKLGIDSDQRTMMVTEGTMMGT
jgi:hypothetical protein